MFIVDKSTYNYNKTKSFLLLSFAILSAAILFALSFPNIFFPKGIAFLAYIALMPISLISTKTYAKKTVGFTVFVTAVMGFIYGFISYALFNVWLFTFSPISFVIVPVIAGVYFLILFLLFRLIYILFPKNWYLIQFLLWVSYEYIRTKGFLGYSFGLLGYSQSFYPSLIQSANIFGVWIVTMMVTFPSFLLAYILHNIITYKSFSRVFKMPFIKYPLYLYMVVFIINITYGFLSQTPFNTYTKNKNVFSITVGLIQHNVNPWLGGIQAYTQSFDTLKKLTEKIMFPSSSQKSKKNPTLIVWPETAFVPSITYHLKYKKNPAYLLLIQNLMGFLSQYPKTEFIIGNAEILGPEEKKSHNVSTDEAFVYNAALFYKGKIKQDVYYKTHLVPFTEHFPNTFPLKWFYTFLQKNDIHFWKRGTRHNVFKSSIQNPKHTAGIKYALSICFEDGFGVQTTKSVQAGANIIINITDDSWSKVESNAMQHLQLSIMRAVENRRSVIRSTNAGMTAVINPNGHITSMLPSFTKAALVENVFIYDEVTTMYTRFGDYFVISLLILCTGIIGYKIYVYTYKHKKLH